MSHPKTSCLVRGFTLIEVLVSIFVIGLLLSLLLPALAGAKTTGSSLVCLTRLSTNHRLLDRWSNENDGALPTPFYSDGDAESVSIGWDQVSYGVTTSSGGDLWLHAIEEPSVGALKKPDYEAYSCPEVYRRDLGLDQEADQQDLNPHLYALQSYFGSPTLYTDPSYWDPRDLSVRHGDEMGPDQRARVRIHQVRRPSEKARLAERSDYHAREPRWVADPLAQHANVLFIDGHAGRVSLARIPKSLTVTSFGFARFSPWSVPGAQAAVPFLGTPGGYLGADVPAGSP
ncbi:MAG: prepilin-type N-terminal cleavage/methylation domain-containing protein [Planctomycetota bacterium]